MSNYTKSTDFASKDTLPSGDSAKIVRGTEIDAEFEALEVAIATKANTSDVSSTYAPLNSPTFTGSPVLPTGTTAVTQTAGDNDTSVATTAFVSAITGTSGITALKNRLINAQGLVNQRGYASGTATTISNQYTVDRWRVVTSGQNLAFSTTNNVVIFTAPSGGVEQVIEGLNLESGTYVLSWTGTATATVAGSSVTNGGTVTVVGGTNTTIKFSSGTFSLPQFEKSSTATSFDYRPYGTELALCQRYYEVGDAFFINYNTVSSNGGYAVQFKATKRSTPSITQTNSGVTSYSTTTNNTNITVNSFTTYRACTTNGGAQFVETWTASSEL